MSVLSIRAWRKKIERITKADTRLSDNRKTDWHSVNFQSTYAMFGLKKIPNRVLDWQFFLENMSEKPKMKSWLKEFLSLKKS